MDGYKIPRRFGHLLAFDLQEAVVHPEIRHYRRLECAARLRNFVLMMRKHEIDTPTVDVEGFPEMFPRHRRAFDVPAGTARFLDASRRRPGRLAGTGWLPQHEVHRILFEWRDLDAGARDHLVERAIGELAVVLHRRDVEED